MDERPLNVVCKRGSPLFYLPREAPYALRLLDLYPAQTLKARLFVWGLRIFCKLGFSPGRLAEKDPFPIGDKFKEFLSSVARDDLRNLQWGMLAGNPNVRGRCYILLLYLRGDPLAVVKIGVDIDGIKRIRAEHAILKEVGRRSLMHCPRVLGFHENDEIAAIAMDYVKGKAISDQLSTGVPKILQSWVLRDQELIPFSKVPAARRLEAELDEAKVGSFHDLWSAKMVPIVPAFSHGDFTPWNIRATREGKLTVLDWERAEKIGVPSWDWFHYIVQPSILVRKERAPQTLALIRSLFESPEFQDYALKTGIEKIARELFVAYLLYSIHVLKPTEGLDATKALLDHATQMWGLPILRSK